MEALGGVLVKKFHIAIGVRNIDESINDYSVRLGQRPHFVVPDEYALWRTPTLNFSIRKSDDDSAKVRHLGWEDAEVANFTSETDVNGIVWERFNPQNQVDEINAAWPGVKCDGE